MGRVGGGGGWWWWVVVVGGGGGVVVVGGGSIHVCQGYVSENPLLSRKYRLEWTFEVP